MSANDTIEFNPSLKIYTYRDKISTEYELDTWLNRPMSMVGMNELTLKIQNETISEGLSTMRGRDLRIKAMEIIGRSI